MTTRGIDPRRGEFEGLVVNVIDGDTLDVQSERGTHRVRLAGIDAPESSQPFGLEAKMQLLRLCFDKRVQVTYHKTDRDRRPIGKVVLEGRDINLQQVVTGHAWHFKSFEREQTEDERQRYRFAEENAKRTSVGLWVVPNPIPPWDWRRGKRSQSATSGGR